MEVGCLGQVFVTLLSGKTQSVPWSDDLTVDDLKAHMSYLVGPPPSRYHFLWNGRLCPRSKPLCYYGVVAGDTLRATAVPIANKRV